MAVKITGNLCVSNRKNMPDWNSPENLDRLKEKLAENKSGKEKPGEKKVFIAKPFKELFHEVNYDFELENKKKAPVVRKESEEDDENIIRTGNRINNEEDDISEDEENVIEEKAEEEN